MIDPFAGSGNTLYWMVRRLADCPGRGFELDPVVCALTTRNLAIIKSPIAMVHIGRCQLHKIRNVADKLPDQLASTVTSRMRKAYHADSAPVAQAQLEALAKELERTHPGAAGSLREGLAETLTVLRPGVSPALARTLRSTNSIESMISIARTHSNNVKNWQNGTMALRWCAAGMIEARGQFRRVNGHLHLPALRAALDATSPPKLSAPSVMMNP
jgi:transposase-like protein